MRKIDLTKIDTNDPIISAWITRARSKTTDLRTKRNHEERSQFINDNPIWSDLKEKIKEIYGAKCWYSDCSLIGTDGDIDHFRPKNRVLDENENVIKPDGYWWLAYEINNYRLSCTYCNQKRRINEAGKMDHFPIRSGGIIITEADDLDREEYAFIDPTKESDVRLIDYNEAGEVIAVSNDDWEMQRVALSKKFYSLDINGFTTERKRIRQTCNIYLKIYENSFISNDRATMEMVLGLIKNITAYKAPYSSVAIKYINSKIMDKEWKDAVTIVMNLDYNIEDVV